MGPTNLGASQAGDVVNCTAAIDRGAYRIFLEVSPSKITYNELVRTMTASPGFADASSVVDFLRSVGLASSAWTDTTAAGAGRSLVWVTYQDATQPTLFLADSGGLVVAKALPAQAGG